MKPKRLLFALSLALVANTGHAATIYWDGAGAATWGTVANWSTLPGADNPDPAAVPVAADTAVFNISTINTASVVYLGADRPVTGLSFVSSGTVGVQADAAATANRTLTLGSGGITRTGAGTVTIGNTTANLNVPVALSASQSWTNNNNTGTVNVVNTVNSSSAGAKTLTLTGTGVTAAAAPGNSAVTGVIANGSGTIALSKTGAGIWALGSGTVAPANTYTGGTSVTGGTLRIEAPAAAGTYTHFGTGTVTVNAATLWFYSPGTTSVHTWANAFSLTNATVLADDSFTTLTGGIAMDGINTMTVRWNNKPLTLSGSISGIGTILKNDYTLNTRSELILSGNSTFSGAVNGGVMTVVDGHLHLQNAGALGNHSHVLVNSTANTTTGNNNFKLSNNITTGAGKTLILRNHATNSAIRSYLENVSGNNTWAGNILIENTTNQSATSTAGTLTLAGTILNSATSPSTNFMIRGNSNGVVTGTISLGSASLGKTETGTWTISSTGNVHNGTNLALGTLIVNNNNALDPTKFLAMGQDTNGTRLTINAGFSQEFSAISNVSNGAHIIDGAGSLSVGGSAKTFTINNGTAADDLTISTPITGSGGFIKAGAGTLVLTGNTVSGPVNVTDGTLRGSATLGGLSVAGGATLVPGTTTVAGTLTTPTLAFGTGATTLSFNLNSDVINVTGSGGLTQAGTTTINLVANGGVINTASTFYPILSYTGTSPGLSGFVLGTLPGGRVAGTLTDNGSAIGITTTRDRIIWTGSASGAWDGAAINWKKESDSTATTFLTQDDVIFDDSGLTPNASIALTGTIDPVRVQFLNTSGTYTLASGTLLGTDGMSLVKANAGTVVLSNTNTYTGPTSITGGTLQLNHATGTLVNTSGVNISSGATLRLVNSDADFVFNRVLSGAGTVRINPQTSGASTTARGMTLSGTSPSFSGSLILEAPAGTGGTRALVTPAATGTSTITVENENQLWVTAGGTFPNNATLTGNGFNDAAASMGAMRLDGGVIWNGTITATGTAGNSGGTAYDARIGNNGFTSTLNGAIGGGDLNFFAYSTSTANFVLTSANTYGDTIIGASSDNTSTGGQAFVVIGGNQAVPTNTTATLGTGTVYLVPSNNATPKPAILRFNRSNGYTLGQNITALPVTSAQHTGARVLIDNTGAGVDFNGKTVDLSDGTNGGYIGVSTLASGSVLNIPASTTVETGTFWLGEASTLSGTVNQTGGSVTASGEMRVGHYPSETSTYNISAGTLTVTPAVPSVPSSTGEVVGGIYVGIDGTGIFNQSGTATVTTGYVVLDNRGDTAGTDQYNLSGGTLALKTAYGLIARNASTAFNWNGGTIQNAGSSIAVALNTPITVGASGGTLDTVSGTNSFVLMNDLLGTGTITTSGGGVVTLQPDSNATRTGTSTGTGTQTIAAVLGGTSAVTKIGTGTSTISSTSTYSGATTVSAGRLNVSGSIANSAVTVANSATIGGEGTVGDLTFGSGGTTNLLVDGTTTGALTAGVLTVNGTVSVDFSKLPNVNGPIKLLNFTSTTVTAANFTLVNAGTYRSATFTVNANDVTVDITRNNLVWNGTTATWEIGGADNDWNLTDQFTAGDGVLFDDTALVPQTIAITGLPKPSAITFNNTVAYTLSGTTGNGIAGLALPIIKNNTGNLTLGGDNTYTGSLAVNGGKVTLGSANGFGAIGNSVTIASGAQVNFNGVAPGIAKAYSFTIAGNGTDSRGAIVNETASIVSNSGIQNLTLTGDASIGTYGGTLPDGNRLDIGLGTLNGNGFTLTKLGDAMLNLRSAGSNVSIVVAAGSLRGEDNDLAFGNTSLTVYNGASVDNWGTRTFPVPVTLNNGATLKSMSGTGTWTGAVSVLDSATFAGTGTATVLSGTVTQTGSGVLSKTESSTLILTGTNSLNGKWNVATGVLRVATDGALGTAPGSPVADFFTLSNGARLQSGNAAAGVDLTLSANRGITLSAGEGGFAILTGSTLSYAGPITGAGSLSKSDVGTLVYTGTANHTGNTNLNGGTLTLGSGAVINGTANVRGGVAGSVLNVLPGASVTTVGGATGYLVLGDATGASTTVNQSGGTVTNAGTQDNPGGNVISNRWGHWGTAATGTYNLTGGSLNLTGAKLYLSWDSAAYLNISGTGVANLKGIEMGYGARVNESVINLQNGGRLNIGVDGITSNGTANKSILMGTATLGAWGNWTSPRPMAVTGALAVDTLDSVDNTTARTITLTGTLSGVGSLTKNNAGTLSLGATGALVTNTYTGGTTVNAGQVNLYGSNNGQSVVGLGTLTVNIGATVTAYTHNVIGQGAQTITPVVIAGGTFETDAHMHAGRVTMTGGSLGVRAGVTQVDGLDMRANGGFNPSITTLANATSATVSSKMTVNTATTVTTAEGAAATDLLMSGQIAGSSSVTKDGSGLMSVTAGNTYSGGTTVTAGTLAVNNTTGSGTGTGAVTVATTGTLAGTGTVSGATTINGTVAPGNAGTGTLAFGSTVNLASGSTYAVGITGASAADKIAVTGALTANATIAVTISGYTPVGGEEYDIADFASITGTPAFNFTAAALSPGLLWDTTEFATNGKIKVVLDDPFVAWGGPYGITSADKGADLDKDGTNNLLEFATGSDPDDATKGANVYPKMHVISGDNVLTFTVAVRKDAVFAVSESVKQSATKDLMIYTIEASENLTDWDEVVVTELDGPTAAAVQAAITPALPALDSDWEWHTFRTDDGTSVDAKDFIRLKVVTTP